jgi:hypothetical protein
MIEVMQSREPCDDHGLFFVLYGAPNFSKRYAIAILFALGGSGDSVVSSMLLMYYIKEMVSSTVTV